MSGFFVFVGSFFSFRSSLLNRRVAFRRKLLVLQDFPFALVGVAEFVQSVAEVVSDSLVVLRVKVKTA